MRDDELLAVVLGTIDPSLARRILADVQSLRGLADLCADELVLFDGVGVARAARVAAGLELGRRTHQQALARGTPLLSAAGAARHVRDLTALSRNEEFHLVMLDTKSRVLGHRVVSVGTLQASLVHPREVFRPAIRAGAASILVAHNHPSGDPTPSSEDRAVTERLEEVGRWVGIPLVDHLVIGDAAYWSFAQERKFPWPKTSSAVDPRRS